MTRRKDYDENFKKELVKYIVENNKPIVQGPREINLNVNTIRTRVKKYGQNLELKKERMFSTPAQESKAIKGRCMVCRRKMS